MFPLSFYFEVFHDYFTSNYVSIGLAIGFFILAFCFAGFKLSSRAEKRSRFLIPITFTSASIWVFVLSSLAFCVMFAYDYWESSLATIALVSRLAIACSAIIAALSMLLFRKRALNGIYEIVKGDSIQIENTSEVTGTIAKLNASFKEIKSRIVGNDSRFANVHLALISKDSYLPASLSLDSPKARLVAIKQEAVDMLDEDELNAVVAHELGHIKHRDALQKSIATAYKLALPFDPIARLVEAAIYRERELAADEYSARLTKKSASLASALLKIYENIQMKPFAHKTQTSYLLNSRGHRDSLKMGILSKEPSLGLRIQRLLEMSKTL